MKFALIFFLLNVIIYAFVLLIFQCVQGFNESVNFIFILDGIGSDLDPAGRTGSLLNRMDQIYLKSPLLFVM